jgi:hypothetical protein
LKPAKHVVDWTIPGGSALADNQSFATLFRATVYACLRVLPVVVQWGIVQFKHLEHAMKAMNAWKKQVRPC